MTKYIVKATKKPLKCQDCSKNEFRIRHSNLKSRLVLVCENCGYVDSYLTKAITEKK